MFIFTIVCGVYPRIKDWDWATIATAKDIVIEILFD